MEPFIGQIMMFAGNYAPQGWAKCDGQLLPVSGNDALFSLLGTIYGGDGRTTFGLPDLRGRAPLHLGTGPGLSNRRIGQKMGSEQETLSAAHLPRHGHEVNVCDLPPDSPDPTGALLAHFGGLPGYKHNTTPTGFASSSFLAESGGGQSTVGNVQPFLGLQFCIALQGIYPSRT